MKQCSAEPYEGTEKYIFISYCHNDKAQVFPIIEQMAKDGYRIWYDDGIKPGSAWPEIIAHHLNGSSICIAFISENSLNSHNCRREINFALLKKKHFISVILEPVQMSLGMEMQLTSSQSVFRYKMSSDAEFLKKLYEAEKLSDCIGEKNNSIRVSSPEEYISCDKITQTERETFSDKWFINAESERTDKNIIENNTDKPIPPEASLKNPVLKKEENAQQISNAEKNSGTQTAQQPPAEEKDMEAGADNTKIFICSNKACGHALHVLKREKTNEMIYIKQHQFVVGRSENMADYTIYNNRMISRVHVLFIIENDVCYVIDNKSLNKTYLNDKQLTPDKRYPLKNGDIIRLYNEHFEYIYIK